MFARAPCAKVVDLPDGSFIVGYELENNMCTLTLYKRGSYDHSIDIRTCHFSEMYSIIDAIKRDYEE